MLVATADQHDRVRRRHRVGIGAIRQAVFLQLGFVPVAVRHDHIVGPALLTRRDRGEDVGGAAYRRSTPGPPPASWR
jgi:hypothetical protein